MMKHSVCWYIQLSQNLASTTSKMILGATKVQAAGGEMFQDIMALLISF